MKKHCPICQKEKARRRCPRHGNEEICSGCCAEMRGAACAGCVHYSAAARHLAAGKSKQATKLREFIIEVEPEIENAVDAAISHLEAGRLSTATTAMEKLIRLHPDNHVVCFGMGVVLSRRAQYGEAIIWFDRATSIYPFFSQAYFNKGVCCIQTENILGVVESFGKAIEFGNPTAPETAKARGMLANVVAHLRKTQGIGLDDFVRACRLFDEAVIHMEAGEWQAAADGFAASIAVNPRTAAPHGNLGLCHLQLGRKADALAAFNRALEISPDYEPAITNRAVAERMNEAEPLDPDRCDLVDIAELRRQREMERWGESSP